MNAEIQKMTTQEQALVTAKIIRASIRKNGIKRPLFTYLKHAERIHTEAEDKNDPIIDVLDFYRDFMLRLQGRQLEKDSVKLLLDNLNKAINGR
jgi:hypothetical protein